MSDNYLDDKKKDSIINDSKKTAEEQIKVNNLEKAHQLKSHFSDSLGNSFGKDAKYEVNDDKLRINIKFQEKEQEDLIEKLVQEKLKQKEEQKMSQEKESLKNNDLIKQHEKMWRLSDYPVQHVVKEPKVEVKESTDTTKTEVVYVEEKKKKCGWLWILLPLLLLILLILLIILLARGCSDKKVAVVPVVKEEKEVTETKESQNIDQKMIMLEAEKTRLEAERTIAEKEAQVKAEAERIRLEAERSIAEKESQARTEAERIRLEAEKARLETERIIKEKEVQLKLEAEKARLEAERVVAEKQAQVKAEAEKVRLEAEKKAEEVKTAIQEKFSGVKEEAKSDENLIKYYKASKGTYDPSVDVSALKYHIVLASTPDDPDMLYILDNGEEEISGKVAYYDGFYQVFVGKDGTRYFLGNPDYDVYQYKILTEKK